ncbi:MAG TPA: S8 family serine peptidase, partial [Anaerolineae bacterium]|nr:S8 family serine peptidase [Anaerolineae bacterium]
CSTVRDPIALYDDVFSVGAIDRNKRLASFSSRGPVLADDSGRVKPDIAAPGVAVNSSLPGGTYGALSGTSMAGPHIVGVVALMWSANPKLIGNIDTTEQILRETAQRGGVSFGRIVCGDPNAVPNDLDGYGIVDAYAAVQRALTEQ